MIFEGKNQEILEIFQYKNLDNSGLQLPLHTDLSIIWFVEDGSEMVIDTTEYHFKKNQILCLTEFNKIEKYHIKNARQFRFNHAFYCVISRDEEVSCKGTLFYGANDLPIFNLKEKDAEVLEIIWKIFLMEIQLSDETQLEMLQMQTKRLLLILNRIHKNPTKMQDLPTLQYNLLREFSFLVETHFKKKLSVDAYAQMLNKSPKTLSNIFKKTGFLSPLQIINNRIILESKRLLCYSELQISEIGYELGYEDVQSFSRFFKKQTGISPSDFRQLNLRKD